MDCKSVEFDYIAENIFAPIYPDIAHAILQRTGIKTGSLLDLGCGGGHLGFALWEQGNFSDLTLSDLSQTALDLAEKRAEKLGVSVSCVCANVEKLPFADGSFDLVSSRGSMPFWEHQETAFQEIFRVLKPGGCAYIGCGLASKVKQESIREKMKENGFACFDHSLSKALSTEEYIALFQQWGADWEVIANEEEGRWFLFRKKNAE